ncbi:MAG: hypothetical protein HY592_00455 [Candidatus Omnitrophica bacterium]|nr:hypothetical protein [Candidatus Omnitrophota bacterium]
MDRRLYHEIWKLRFDKMLELEKKSVADYTALLEESRRRHKGHSIEPHLERLITDEKKHTLLVEELIKILSAQPE